MWSHDYCTVCDKQCAIGAMYCSEKCRFMEMNKCTSENVDWIYSSLNYTKSHISIPKNRGCDHDQSPCHIKHEACSAIPPSPSNQQRPSILTIKNSESSVQSKSFLYASPLLIPQSTAVLKNNDCLNALPVSPPLSPLLMSPYDDDEDDIDSEFEGSTPISVSTLDRKSHMSSIDIVDGSSHENHLKSSTNYRRWLTAV